MVDKRNKDLYSYVDQKFSDVSEQIYVNNSKLDNNTSTIKYNLQKLEDHVY